MKTGSGSWLERAVEVISKMRVAVLEFLDADVFNITPDVMHQNQHDLNKESKQLMTIT